MTVPIDPLPLEVECSAVRAARDAGEDFLLLDCRERDEHAVVSLAGAMLLPMSELVERAAELAPHRGRRIVVYCHVGGRSLRVAVWLRQQGFHHVQNMIGGIDRWAREIDPALPRY